MANGKSIQFLKKQIKKTAIVSRDSIGSVPVNPEIVKLSTLDLFALIIETLKIFMAGVSGAIIAFAIDDNLDGKNRGGISVLLVFTALFFTVFAQVLPQLIERPSVKISDSWANPVAIFLKVCVYVSEGIIGTYLGFALFDDEFIGLGGWIALFIIIILLLEIFSTYTGLNPEIDTENYIQKLKRSNV